ncbi:MAG TPA: hypothetical protein VN436_03390 [Holophaga sp.]|nr:hypothetical protein [Holophaga sp.]
MNADASTPLPEVRSGQRIGSAQLIFLASMVALDFAFGMVAKPLMHATGLGMFIKVEMIVPAMLWALSRLTLDRFGVGTAYQLAWGSLAIVLMPMAVLPGPLKLFPMAVQGLCLDAVYSGMRRLGPVRVYVAAIVSAFIGSACMAAMQVYMGLPWAQATRILIGFQALTSVAIHLAGGALALLIWRRVKDLQVVRLLRAGA